MSNGQPNFHRYPQTGFPVSPATGGVYDGVTGGAATRESVAQTATALDTSKRTCRLIDRLSSSERKEYPIGTGFVDYFPDAMALVSHLSWAGNEKHNRGEPLHHARSKSADQIDCVMRHMTCRDSVDYIDLGDRKVEIPHRVAMAWRAMAELQVWAEAHYGLALAPGARP